MNFELGMWSNYHLHSSYCDGKSTIQDCVDKGVEKNLICMGFSSHAPLPFDCRWCMKVENLKAYLQEIDELKQTNKRLELYKGLEVDFIPGVISPDTFREQLDYTIGSIHFVDQFQDGRRWEIDGAHAFFLEGLEHIFKNDARKATTRYFSLTREMIQTSPPDIVGHLDKIKMQNLDNKLFNETDSWYRDEIIKTLDVVAKAGCILEVNTRGIYQRKTSTTYPSPWVLEIAHQKNIPITLSSDAHHPDDLTNQFEDTSSLLLKTGFKKITILKGGTWQPLDFTPHGIIIPD